jgi:carboxypeptidase C (cathepsin A)
MTISYRQTSPASQANSSHMVPIDEPEVITRAIHEAVEQERGRRIKSETP